MPYQIEVDVSYGQIAIFLSSIQQPFNDWTEEHLKQGFSWRVGSVSFKTFAESGRHNIDIDIKHNFSEINYNSIRVIEVPFFVTEEEIIEVGSIIDMNKISIPKGNYIIRCQFIKFNKNDDYHKVIIEFIKTNCRYFSIVLCDNELKPPAQLITNADPA